MTQLVLSVVDWVLAGAVLYVLLPSGSVPFLAFLGAFLAAILVGMASHVPGGLGVFDGLMVLLLKPYLRSADVLPALVVFRGVYYLLPFAVAVVGLAVDEFWQRRAQTARVTAVLGRAHRAGHSAALRPADVPVGIDPAVLRRHAGGARSPGAPRGMAAARSDRDLAFHRQPGRAWSCCSSRRDSRGGSTPRITSRPERSDVGIATTILKGLDYEEAVLLACVLVFLIRAHAGVRSPRRVLRDPLLHRLGGDRARHARRVGVAGLLRVQARELLRRAVVGVRAARRGVALPARPRLARPW